MRYSQRNSTPVWTVLSHFSIFQFFIFLIVRLTLSCFWLNNHSRSGATTSVILERKETCRVSFSAAVDRTN
jgi:hypothetical protein